MILSHASTRPLAYEQATSFARQRGHVYMMQWPTGHWTVETHKSIYSRRLAADTIIRVSETGAQRTERTPTL